jgi:hypothetical protein
MWSHLVTSHNITFSFNCSVSVEEHKNTDRLQLLVVLYCDMNPQRAPKRFWSFLFVGWGGGYITTLPLSEGYTVEL